MMKGLEEILKMCQNCYRSYQSWQCRHRCPGHHQCPCNKQTQQWFIIQQL